MSVSAAPLDPPGAEHADLSGFGYTQQLHRGVGSFSSFAAGFSFVSILTTVFQLFAFGFSFGGPAFFWTWPIVFVGQLMVALCFSELAARYPISGCIYQWATRFGGTLWGWTAGWLMLVGQVVTVAAAAIAMQIVLPAIWSGFQVLDSPTANAVLLGSGVLAVTTLANLGLSAVYAGLGATAGAPESFLLAVGAAFALPGLAILAARAMRPRQS